MALFNTFFSRNRATSVGALQSLATVTPPAGQYEVVATIYFSGTAPVDGVDNDNVCIFTDNVITAAILPCPAVAGVVATFRVLVNTVGTNIKLGAIGAGTLATIYNTSIEAIPLASSFINPSV